MTLKEYLMDYASPATRQLGENLIQQELGKLPDDNRRQQLAERLRHIEAENDQDLLF